MDFKSNQYYYLKYSYSEHPIDPMYHFLYTQIGAYKQPNLCILFIFCCYKLQHLFQNIGMMHFTYFKNAFANTNQVILFLKGTLEIEIVRNSLFETE